MEIERVTERSVKVKVTCIQMMKRGPFIVCMYVGYARSGRWQFEQMSKERDREKRQAKLLIFNAISIDHNLYTHDV